MGTIIAFNTTVEHIIEEISKFDSIEQQAILAYLRARRIKANPIKLTGGPKAISMKTIDAIKHKSRLDACK